MNVQGGRQLLNLPGFESTAAIVAEMQSYGTGVEDYVVVLDISDCQRKVSLSLCTPGADTEQFENTMFKLDAIVYRTLELQKAMRRERRKLVRRGAVDGP